VIPAQHAHLTVRATTHPGMSGKNNEDRYGVSAYRLDHDSRTPVVLAIVSDGIGGHQAGEVAAEMAVEMISQIVAESDAQTPLETLQDAFVRAGQVIYDAAENDLARQGMGATCVTALVLGDHLYAASLGDSRLYLLRGERIVQVTTDHTWVQEAIEKGYLMPEEARHHPNAHVIRRYLGSRQASVPDFRLRFEAGNQGHASAAYQGYTLQAGDILVLCTDGLTDLVEDEEIFSAFKSLPAGEAQEYLVNLANQRGGHDNITIVSLRMPPPAPVTKPRQPAGRWLRIRGLLLMLSAFVLGVGGIAGGYYWYMHRGGDNPGREVTPVPGKRTVISPVLAPENVQPNTNPPVPTFEAPALEPRAIATVARDLSATLTPWPTNTLFSSP